MNRERFLQSIGHAIAWFYAGLYASHPKYPAVWLFPICGMILTGFLINDGSSSEKVAEGLR